LKVFIDSNIPMYVAGGDHPHREPARKFLERVRTGEAEGVTSTEVLQEILYRYAAIGRKEMGGDIYDLFVEICPVVLSVTLADTDRARDLLLAVDGISARDAVHAAVMLNHEIKWVATYDEGFSGIPGVRRWKI
jgi:predicted nucleic acid-binding protein